jgi:hypothetical protein
MIRKFLAWSLFVLAVSPVTAPFSTCDLAALFDHPSAPYRATSFVRSDVQQTDGTCANDVLLVSPSTRIGALVKVSVIATCSLLPAANDPVRASADLFVLDPRRLHDGHPAVPAVLRL